MSPRVPPILVSLVGLALACTVTSDPADTDASTSSASGPTSTSATTSTTATTATASTTASGTTGPDDPTTAGTTATTEASSVGSEDSSASEPGTASGDSPVFFTEVFEQVIMPNACNSGYCHGGGAGGLELTDEATSYANLVDMAAASMVCGQSMRVVPGSLDESILWYRVRPAALDGGDPCAPKMPQGSMGLSDAEAQLVNDWIAGGALE